MDITPIRCAYRLLLLTTCLVLITGGVFAAGFTEQMRLEDPRLQKQITLLKPRITVAQFLQAAAQLSGIEIKMENGSPDRDALDKLFITALVRNQSVADSLDSLYSLLSYREAKWQWNRLGAKGAYRYRLTPPRNFQILADRIKAETQSEFEAKEEAMKAALTMSPDALKKAAQNNTDARLLMTGNAAHDTRQRNGLACFFDSLTDEQRKTVLRGERITLPLSDVSDAGRTMTEQQFAASAGLPRPKTLSFFSTRFSDRLTPVLYIEPDSLSAGGFLGNQWDEEKWIDRVGGMWHLSDDQATNLAQDSLLNSPEKPQLLPKDFDADAHPLARLFWQISESSAISLFAVLPASTTVSIVSATPLPTQTSLYNQKLSALLKSISKYPIRYQYKWRHDALLLRNSAEPFCTFWERQATGLTAQP